MKCRLCDVDKLSKEFPHEPITDECDHPLLYCLRCITKKVKETWQCPYMGCDQLVSKDSDRLKDYEVTLDFLFPPMDSLEQEDLQVGDVHLGSGPQTVQVTTLTGDTTAIPFTDGMTVTVFKTKVNTAMKVPPEKQRLIYNGQELEAYKINGESNVLGDFKIRPFSTVHLMIALLEIPDHLNHVVFDLSWAYPSHGRDFLDASCLAFSGDVWYSFVDWREPNDYGINSEKVIWHSGDKVDDEKREGHHIIEVKLKNVPRCVSHLVFTLSSFKSPTISCFRNPKLKFYDALNTERKLCEATFSNALNSQAVIVCCVSRLADGNWKIEKGGTPSAGNVKDYPTLISTIAAMKKSKLITGVLLEQGKTLLHTMIGAELAVYNQRVANRLS